VNPGSRFADLHDPFISINSGGCDPIAAQPEIPSNPVQPVSADDCWDFGKFPENFAEAVKARNVCWGNFDG